MKIRDIILPLALLLGASSASAICPMCTVLVGAGVGVMRMMGVDDTITGMWYGAFIVSSILWTLSWLDKKNIRFGARKLTVTFMYYLLFVGPLYWFNIIIRSPKVYILDRFSFGIILGSIIFPLAVLSDRYLRKINDGKKIIAYQKVLVPLTYLLIASIVSYLTLTIID
jgi:hypothetical protein